MPYITTPIYYVNGTPHIGHAYTTLACDAFLRFQKLEKRSPIFLTGTDEHGQKVEQAANQLGVEPKQFADTMSKKFKDLLFALGVETTDFIRTTELRHQKAATALWNRLDLYLGTYAGWYSVRDETFFSESEIVDQKAPTGAPVSWVEEPSFFFRLSKYQDKLLKFYENNPYFILPKSRYNEVVRFVESGLCDLSVSRTSFSWGIKVPGHPDHVMYVWLDALSNYLTGIGFPDSYDADVFSQAIHIVGKDILRFHAIYWPAFLMEAGLSLPKQIVAHGWLTNSGQKMSKSLGNTIDPFELIKNYGSDVLRFYLLREIPFGQDGDFSTLTLCQRLNNDLANTFGNLVQRVFAFIYKANHFFSKVELNETERALINLPYEILDECKEYMSQFLFHRYLDKVFEILRYANAFVDRQKPWELARKDPIRLQAVLFVLVQFIKDVSILLDPFLPKSCGKIFEMLGITNPTFDNLTQPIEGKIDAEPKPLFIKVV